MLLHQTLGCALLALALSSAATALSSAATAQTRFETVATARAALTEAASESDAPARAIALDSLWSRLLAEGDIPLVRGDSALFLWRGAASSVAIAGDHTGWRPARPLERLGESDVWIRADAFPRDARIDYKVVLNGSEWTLDPANPHEQWGGAGPNSELRMPDWREEPETVADPSVPAGTLLPPDTLSSDILLGAPLIFRIYTPPGIDTLADLPVLYVTDGHEYADPRLGAVPTILDNLIASGRIEPTIAVFIDPRFDGENRRQHLYIENPEFADSVALELVPAIDAGFPTRASRDGRVILGTSLGGVFSATLGLAHPDVFGRLAIQSPAFWVLRPNSFNTTHGPPIEERLAGLPPGRFLISMSTGTINDTQDATRPVRDVLNTTGQHLTYREVHQGHSWGNWRGLLPAMLTDLLSPTARRDP